MRFKKSLVVFGGFLGAVVVLSLLMLIPPGSAELLNGSSFPTIWELIGQSLYHVGVIFFPFIFMVGMSFRELSQHQLAGQFNISQRTDFRVGWISLTVLVLVLSVFTYVLTLIAPNFFVRPEIMSGIPFGKMPVRDFLSVLMGLLVMGSWSMVYSYLLLKYRTNLVALGSLAGLVMFGVIVLSMSLYISSRLDVQEMAVGWSMLQFFIFRSMDPVIFALVGQGFVVAVLFGISKLLSRNLQLEKE
jgi:hypothetical protein